MKHYNDNQLNKLESIQADKNLIIVSTIAILSALIGVI